MRFTTLHEDDIVVGHDILPHLNTPTKRRKIFRIPCIYPNGEVGQVYKELGTVKKWELEEKDLLEYFDEKEEDNYLIWRMEAKAKSVKDWMGIEI